MRPLCSVINDNNMTDIFWFICTTWVHFSPVTHTLTHAVTAHIQTRSKWSSAEFGQPPSLVSLLKAIWSSHAKSAVFPCPSAGHADTDASCCSTLLHVWLCLSCILYIKCHQIKGYLKVKYNLAALLPGDIKVWMTHRGHIVCLSTCHWMWWINLSGEMCWTQNRLYETLTVN